MSSLTADSSPDFMSAMLDLDLLPVDNNLLSLDRKLLPVIAYFMKRSFLPLMPTAGKQYRESAQVVARYLVQLGLDWSEVKAMIERDFNLADLSLEDSDELDTDPIVKRANKRKASTIVDYPSSSSSSSSDDDESEPDVQDEPMRKKARTATSSSSTIASVAGKRLPRSSASTTSSCASDTAVAKRPKGPKVYVPAGAAKASIKDPLIYQNQMIVDDVRGIKRPHEKRFICWIRGCNWGTNHRRSEVSPHFVKGAHPGKVYDVEKVLTISWDDFLNDHDLAACARATTQAELNWLLHGDDDEEEEEHLEEESEISEEE